ncbi:MAG: NifU family protein [Nitrolancea sp.]
MLLADRELQELAGRTDALLAGIEALPDPNARERAIEVVQALVQLYGAGLTRIAEQVSERDPAFFHELAADELIGHLLILHNLHPLDVEARVRQALEDVRPYLQSHGGNVELVGIDGGNVLVRLEGSCHGCPSSTMTLKLAIEEAVQKRAPELESVEAVNPTPVPATGNFVPLSSLGSRPASRSDRGGWTTLSRTPSLSNGAMTASDVDGASLLFLKLGETLYAYRDRCPGCGTSLEGGSLEQSILSCGCGARFDVRLAGRSPDSPTLYLEPVPLLSQGSRTQVALPIAAG